MFHNHIHIVIIKLLVREASEAWAPFNKNGPHAGWKLFGGGGSFKWIDLFIESSGYKFSNLQNLVAEIISKADILYEGVLHKQRDFTVVIPLQWDITIWEHVSFRNDVNCSSVSLCST